MTFARTAGTVVVLAVAAVTASARSLELAPGVAPHPQLDSLYGVFSDAMSAMDADALAALYDPHARYLAPGREIREGTDAIRSAFEAFFAREREQASAIDLEFRLVDRSVDGPVAYDVGYYTLVRADNDGSTTETRGKFVVVARQSGDGSWRLTVHSFSDLGVTDEQTR